MSPFADRYAAGFWRQHPYRNLQPLAGTVDDCYRAVSPFRSAKDLNGSTVQWVERIKDLDFCTQGTVGVGVFIPMSTASSLRVGSPSITPAGFVLTLDSFSLSTCSGAYFAESSSTGSSWLFSEGSCTFPAIWRHSLNLRPSPLGAGHCFENIGSSTPNHPSVVRSMCSTTSAVTPTASPSPTTDWFRSMTARSPFVGVIPLTTTSRS